MLHWHLDMISIIWRENESFLFVPENIFLHFTMMKNDFKKFGRSKKVAEISILPPRYQNLNCRTLQILILQSMIMSRSMIHHHGCISDHQLTQHWTLQILILQSMIMSRSIVHHSVCVSDYQLRLRWTFQVFSILTCIFHSQPIQLTAGEKCYVKDVSIWRCSAPSLLIMRIINQILKLNRIKCNQKYLLLHSLWFSLYFINRSHR